MGRILDEFNRKINENNFKEKNGAFIIIENVSISEKDFIRDCQEICLLIAPYSKQEEKSFILNKPIPQPVVGACLFVNNNYIVLRDREKE